MRAKKTAILSKRRYFSIMEKRTIFPPIVEELDKLNAFQYPHAELVVLDIQKLARFAE